MRRRARAGAAAVAGAPVAASNAPLELRASPRGGVALRLRVSASASRTRVLGVHDGALKISVQAPPERGKANRQVRELVAGVFGVPPSAVEFVSGESSPDKVVRVGLEPEDAEARWRAAEVSRESAPGRPRTGS